MFEGAVDTVLFFGVQGAHGAAPGQVDAAGERVGGGVVDE